MKWMLMISYAVPVLFAAEAAGPSLEDVAKTYRQLTRVTKYPREMNPKNLVLCDNAGQPSLLQKHFGPHAIGYEHYYRNAAARQPEIGAWPVGSVLVKEKLSARNATGDPDPADVVAVAGMIKRAPGTAPKSGDWEFFRRKDGKLTTTGLESCAGCHTGARRDFVFTDFAKLAH